MVLNFYAGPATLPAPVVERIHGDLINFQGTGMGVMEISHRATGSFMAARPCWGVASSFLTCTLTVGGRYQRVYWADGHASRAPR